MRHTVVHIALLCALLFVPRSAEASCYLEDATADCEVCWQTQYSSPEDKIGVTTMSECPPSIVLTWEQLLPIEMYEGTSYAVEYRLWLNTSEWFVVARDTKQDGTKDIPHANIHSCVSSRGACTPFVSNTPGLATHTPALVSDLDVDGSQLFHSEVKLTEELYTIIAHLRFFSPHAHDPSLPPTKWDVAIGVSREILPMQVEISADSYITAGILGSLLLIGVSSVFYSARKGYLDVDLVIEVLFSDTATLVADILSGLADVAAFTVGIFSVLRFNNDVRSIIPLCYLFCAVAWIGSMYNAVNDIMQLRTMYLQNYHRTQFVSEMVARTAESTVRSQKETKNLDKQGRRRSIHETSVNFTELIKEQENLDAMLELELAARDYRRKVGDVITILCESIPITAIQSYVLSQGSGGIIAIIALLFASVVMGAKVSGLGQYKQCRLRRDEARRRFRGRFRAGEVGDRQDGGTSGEPAPSLPRSMPPTPVKTLQVGAGDAVLEVGNDVAPFTAVAVEPPSRPASAQSWRSQPEGSRGARQLLPTTPVEAGWLPCEVL